jgi:hypothetical protein
MTTQPRRGLAADTTVTVPAEDGRFARSDRRPRREPSLSRVIEAAFLRADGGVEIRHHRLPDHPLVLEAAGALARGTLLRTAGGPVAVEDLAPGDRLVTAEGDAVPILWIGATTLAPGSGAPPLTRVMPGAFGPGRPASDLLAGPAARRLHAHPALDRLSGTARVLTPLADLRDGEGVIAVTPPGPVRVFQVLTERHTACDAGGLMLETFHPGLRAAETLAPELRAPFLSLFPHLTDFADFGPLSWPRVSGETLARLTAA